MINISSEFKSKLQNRDIPYTVQVQITLAGGTVLNLTNEHILENGISIEDAISDDSSFHALGASVINSANITLNNAYGDFSDYDFKDAIVKIKVGFELSQETELIDKGIFIVDDATYTDFAVRLSCLDNMVKFDKPYSQSTLAYPATLSAIVRDACTRCGVTLATSTFPHSTFSIANKPIDETTTFREVISWAAQIAGCYARINVRGQLELKWFDTSVLVDSLDGGYFDNGTPRYRSGDTADGGSFNPWNIGYESDAGVFTDTDKYHVFAHLFTEDIAVDDTVITGVQIAVNTEDEQSNNVINYYTAGVDGYKITIENNELITVDNAQTIVNWLGTQLISLRFRKVSITHVSDPSIEAGDVGLVYARNSGPYEILITRTNFTPTNSQRTVCASETPVRNSATKYSEASKNYVALQRKITAEKTTREQDIEDLAEAIAGATGMYNTTIQAGQVDPATGQTVTSGSIVYLHDRPLLAESAAVWRMSADAFSVTNNYNGTSTVWIAGLTVDGTLIAEKLSAVGINADWITTGTLKIGGSVTNAHGNLDVYDSSDNRIGHWDNSGLYLGNIENDLTSPNTKLGVTGAVTVKSLTADDYVRVDGNIHSLIKIPTVETSGSSGYSLFDVNGFTSQKEFASSSVNYANYRLRIGNPYDPLYIQQLIGTSVIKFTLSLNYPHLYITEGTNGSYSGDYSSRYIRLNYSDGSTSSRFFSVSDSYVQVGTSSINVPMYIYGNTRVTGNLSCTGTKPRLVTTKNYGERYLYCYETPSPLFGDVGEGKIGEDGRCFVQIDNVFAETVSLSQYQVFLQKYGEGECWVSERNSAYFVVDGTIGLSFGWEIKAKQSDFDQLRLEKEVGDLTKIQNNDMIINYAQELANHISIIQSQREVNPE